MKVLAILVTYNAMKWLVHCVESLQESTVKVDIMVVDNGSTDGTRDQLAKLSFIKQVVNSDENLGFGRANNIGLQYALNNGYDYAYLINQDAWIFPDTLEKLIDVNRAHPEYGLLSPIQMQANMKHLDKDFIRFSISNEAIEDAVLNRQQTLYEATGGIAAAHWLLSRACIEKVGGFSPTFYHYGEDNNYQHRLYFHGMKEGIVINAYAVHDRENRQDGQKKLAYLRSVIMLATLSDPRTPQKYPRLSIAREWINACRQFRSLYPTRFYIKMMGSLPDIAKNKALSKGERAFLK